MAERDMERFDLRKQPMIGGWHVDEAHIKAAVGGCTTAVLSAVWVI